MQYLIDLFDFEIEYVFEYLHDTLPLSKKQSILTKPYSNLQTYELTEEQAVLIKLKYPLIFKRRLISTENLK
jgi:hypothetical protein